jgi:hypothetical protein
MMKKTDFTCAEIVMSIWPTSTPASSTPVTDPRVNFPSLTPPSQ